MPVDTTPPFRQPALYPTFDANDALAHMVQRPDLVRIDQQGQPMEIATLVVNGQIFEDWETVWIRWSWAEPFSEFRFTCAEREPYPLPGQVLQFAPGSNVDIYLGGIQVINGVIVTRQVAYDANQHMVQLQGVSGSWFANRSSEDSTKTGDFSGMGFSQIARTILAPTGVFFETEGFIDETPFQSASHSPGETIGQFLEKLARERKIIISNLPNGRYLFVGPHVKPQVGELIEGVNIKKMQCVISIEAAYSEYKVRGQTPASDSQYGSAASEQEASVPGILPHYSLLLNAVEHPVWSTAELLTRAKTEKMWNEDMTKIEAAVTVYGWFRPLPTVLESWAALQLGPYTGHTLWQAGDEVVVNSPMAMLINQAMKIRTVTWTQDSTNGSQTLLNLTTPQGLNGMPRPAPVADEAIQAAPGPNQTAPM